MKYPRIEAAGLTIDRIWEHANTCYIVFADDLERVLAEAPVVYGGKIPATGFMQYDEEPSMRDTHTARLLCIQSIAKPDTAEKLLAEAMAYLERSYPLMPHPDDEKYRADIAYRARKLLEGK